MNNKNLNVNIYDFVDRLSFEFDELKICYTKKPINAKSEEDRKIICEAEKFNFEKLTFSNQIHSDVVRVIDDTNYGKVEDSDAMITNIRNIPMLIFTADCVPIVLYDIKNKAISVIHAGWKGTIKNIVNNSINEMNKRYGTEAKDIFAIIGPSISMKNYQVNEELVQKFVEELKLIDSSYSDYKIYEKVNDDYYLDLWEINKFMLITSGVDVNNIHNFEICTVEENRNYYSYRLEKQTECRIGTFVELI